MRPKQPLPYSGNFSSAEEYLDRLMEFATSEDMFQILCGGVHILDFFTSEAGLFPAALPQEWHSFLLSIDIMQLVGMLSNEGSGDAKLREDQIQPPESFLQYARSIRNLSLRRTLLPERLKKPTLPKTISIGMNPKKIHEVVNFADYVETLSDNIASKSGGKITHYIDFGSGQNYLGRALASEPYNRRVVAVEGREGNVSAAKVLDVHSRLVAKPKVMRNKKLWGKIVEAGGSDPQADPEVKRKAIQKFAGDETFDFRTAQEIATAPETTQGRGGRVQYVSGRLNSGDMSEIVAKIEPDEDVKDVKKDVKLMAVSIHSCGNLSHFGIRSMIMNPNIRAVAIVGCCYNLLTERLGPPTYKHIYLRPTLQPVNGRAAEGGAARDPQGFPMSEKFANYKTDGIRLNVTARMMACQAMSNWTKDDSEGFFTRHFYRAVLQKIFLDRGVVTKLRHEDVRRAERDREKLTSSEDKDEQERDREREREPETAFNTSTKPVSIGSLRKPCYRSFKAYVRGAMEKLTTSIEYKQYAEVIGAKMGDITDEEIDRYEAQYAPRQQEVRVLWTLMAFSAEVVEALIVADRWTFLREHADVVEDAWVETVFEYKQSPRNLVVVGIKKEGA
jgi:hypothetical protein